MPIASGNPLRPSTTAIRIAHAAGPEIVHDLEPELRAFAVLDPEPEHVLAPFGVERQRDVDRLVANQTFVADLHPQRVEEHDRITGIERPSLPLLDLVQHRVGHPADQVGRYLGAIKLLQMSLYLAN